jgi:hypothetical protein
MADSAQLVAEILRIQTEIMWLMPERDFGLEPSPAATPQAIRRAERRVHRGLPPSYRSFLSRHDGWPRFFEGASLLSTNQLGRRLYTDAARTVFTSAGTPVPDIGPPLPGPRGRAPIPFGADPSCSTIFAFNPDVIDDRGEYEVICWVNEIGLRCDSFLDFLRTVSEHCDSELAGLAQYAELSA